MKGKWHSTGLKTLSPEAGFLEYLKAKRTLPQGVTDKILSQRQPGEGTREVLERLTGLSGDILSNALADYLGLSCISLSQVPVDPGAVRYIPETMAKRYHLIPIALSNGVSGQKVLQVAIAGPLPYQAIEDVRIAAGMEVELYIADPGEIDMAIRRYLTVENSAARLALLPAELAEKGIWCLEEEGEDNEESPTVVLVNSLLKQAIGQNASDIHWEPQGESLAVRFRIDGRLFTVCRLAAGASSSVIARLKVMAGMDVTEHRVPQDGSFTAALRTKRVNLRLSSLPTIYGEKIVVRILDSETARRSLHDLGLSPELETALRSYLSLSHGMLLVVGPTGSGKSTTLYALLQELDRAALNVVSIEDPVEYRIDGVNQVAVNAKTDLTFAKGLRAILRQDPDVIMIGEIRDEETARIAAKAALTGHLVLSTLHTNTAAEAFTRLLDMGLEPYLVAASIKGVLAQRLVRRLCRHCKTLFEGEPASYQPQGCFQCRGTGYAGRTGIYELLPYSREIKDLILNRWSGEDIENLALRHGMVTLWDDGLEKAAKGITTVEEVISQVGDRKR